jgi:hypothetical protein
MRICNKEFLTQNLVVQSSRNKVILTQNLVVLSSRNKVILTQNLVVQSSRNKVILTENLVVLGSRNYAPGSGFSIQQCCGTGTGTVGTVTFCLVEPEPKP